MGTKGEKKKYQSQQEESVEFNEFSNPIIYEKWWTFCNCLTDCSIFSVKLTECQKYYLHTTNYSVSL